jgi:hypothetical protein
MGPLTRKASSPSLLPPRSRGVLGIGSFAIRLAIAICLGLYIHLLVFRYICGIPVATVRRNRGAVRGFHVHFGMYPERGDIQARPRGRSRGRVQQSQSDSCDLSVRLIQIERGGDNTNETIQASMSTGERISVREDPTEVKIAKCSS